MGNNINVNKIQEYLKDKGLSKTEFCKKCKVSVSTFSKILNHNGNFRVIALFRIAQEMQINIHELFTE